MFDSESVLPQKHVIVATGVSFCTQNVDKYSIFAQFSAIVLRLLNKSVLFWFYFCWVDFDKIILSYRSVIFIGTIFI